MKAKISLVNFQKIWQNFKDYTYLCGINLSLEQIDIIEQDSDPVVYIFVSKVAKIGYKAE